MAPGLRDAIFPFRVIRYLKSFSKANPSALWQHHGLFYDCQRFFFRQLCFHLSISLVVFYTSFEDCCTNVYSLPLILLTVHGTASLWSCGVFFLPTRLLL